MNTMEKITNYEHKHDMIMALYKENPIMWDNTGSFISIVENRK